MKTRNWLFVTGVPRSGTTFLGKILSLPRAVDYLHEPFNPVWGMQGIDRQYLYVRKDDPSAQRYRDLIDNLFTYNFTYKVGGSTREKQWKQKVRQVVGSRRAWSLYRAKLNPFHTTMIIKDPIGCLLTEYLAQTYDIKPVIIIRHPLAVVASALRLNLSIDLAPLRQQRALIEDYFADEAVFLNMHRLTLVENTAALWRALNKVLLIQSRRHPDWKLVTHEALAQNPIQQFQILYEDLGLPWSSSVHTQIQKLTGQNNPVDVPSSRFQALKRNSGGLFRHSFERLPQADRETVLRITEDIALQFYPETSFHKATAFG